MGKTCTIWRKLANIILRFESKYIPEPNSGCWIWLGATNKDGYGRFKFHNKLIGAHRASMMIYNEQENSSMCVLHKCDNPYCVNPNHLFFGTHLDNMRDKKKKGRVGFNPSYGEEHYNSKLKIEDITSIRTLSSKGHSNKEIAVLFDINPSTVSQIIRRVTWKHI